MGYDQLSLIALPSHGDFKRKKTRLLQATCSLEFVKITCDYIILE